MTIVFPFIVLKYFSFCCHSSHSILFRNPLFYSSFVLFVKSDSKLNQNSSCQLFILFNLFVPISVYSLFFYNLTFLISGSYFLCFLSFLLLCLFYYFVFSHSVFLLLCLYVTLSFLLFCLYIILSFLFFCLFYYFVFMSFCLFSFCLFSSFCRTSFPLFSLSFWLHFYPFICLFFDIFA